MRPSFLFQDDAGVSLVERKTVRQAVLLGAGEQLRRSTLRDLTDLPANAWAELRAFCPVGTVEFVRAWMRATGVTEPEPVDYPGVLQPELHRAVRLTTFERAAIGSWVKPVHTKVWDAGVKQSDDDHAPQDPVWECAVIPETDWRAEWRVYVVEGRIVGQGRYDSHPDDALAFDAAAVQSWVEAYTASGQAPAGYALDVALWPKGQTVLVEVTDGWAIGYYRGTCEPTDYARLLAARWGQIAGVRP